jgi:hypothetical protein
MRVMSELSHFSKNEFEDLKQCIFRLRDSVLCVGLVLLVTVRPWSLLLVVYSLALATFYLYRAKRNWHRRCPECTQKILSVFRGWNFTKRYSRGYPIIEGKMTCHFNCTCGCCGYYYQVKEPEAKSFSHRLRYFRNW